MSLQAQMTKVISLFKIKNKINMKFCECPPPPPPFYWDTVCPQPIPHQNIVNTLYKVPGLKMSGLGQVTL